jgi:phosphoribosylformylglycinamidine synthase
MQYPDQAIKKKPQTGDKINNPGENYRIGMGGAAVSSADTGVQELNAIQRVLTQKCKNVLPMPFVVW